ncbi:hypothetical protein CGRA01v4_07757 [Colletotrichum graminicola]|nr:hypothetical protein CGRA01v4_07757 [Colletotrichum graminicola]
MFPRGPCRQKTHVRADAAQRSQFTYPFHTLKNCVKRLFASKG